MYHETNTYEGNLNSFVFVVFSNNTHCYIEVIQLKDFLLISTHKSYPIEKMALSSMTAASVLITFKFLDRAKSGKLI